VEAVVAAVEAAGGPAAVPERVHPADAEDAVGSEEAGDTVEAEMWH
jgi:hypothetical protein